MFDLMPFERRNRDLVKYLDNFDKEFFGNMLEEFKTDIEDKGDRFVLEAELPGFAKEDIKIDIEDNRLTIHAEHNNENETKEKNYIRRERSYGSFERSFDISNINAEGITAEYKNGVLELVMPKLAEVKPEVKRIDIR